MKLEDLKKPFDPKLISWRVGATTADKSSGIALAYIDARDVRQRLNDVCGAANWTCEHYDCGNGKLGCKIGIRINGEWVYKTDGAGATDVEADKGAFSDALKRAAVAWGVGEYLYDVHNVWVDLTPKGKSYIIKNPNDSRLVGALEKAASGIRVIGEDPKEDPKDAEREKIVKRIASIMSEISEAPDVANVGEIINKHISEINGFSKAQQDHINSHASKIRNALAQKPAEVA